MIDAAGKIVIPGGIDPHVHMHHQWILPDGTPLILDSHGEGVKDSNGKSIPCGINLRPFRKNSWYFKSASHAHRLFTKN